MQLGRVGSRCETVTLVKGPTSPVTQFCMKVVGSVKSALILVSGGGAEVLWTMSERRERRSYED